MLKAATKKYSQLMLELAVRRDNEHIGSGLGGNPEEFLTMLALTPSFEESDKAMFVVENDFLLINTTLFNTASLRDLRKNLSEVLGPHIEKYAHPNFVKLLELPISINNDLALPSKEVARSERQRELFSAYRLGDQIKKLVEEEFEVDASTAKPLAECSPQLQDCYNQLCQLDYWATLAALRSRVGIDLLVKYNLDETFGELLTKISNFVENQ